MKTLTAISILMACIFLAPVDLLAEATTWSFSHHPVDQFTGIVRTGGPDYYGNMPAQPGTGEVVVQFHETGLDGFEIPLPIYPSDNETADLSEVFWLISPGGATMYAPLEPGSITADFTGTTLSLTENDAIVGFILRITVIAVRQGQVTETENSSWGSVKEMFR